MYIRIGGSICFGIYVVWQMPGHRYLEILNTELYDVFRDWPGYRSPRSHEAQPDVKPAPGPEVGPGKQASSSTSAGPGQEHNSILQVAMSVPSRHIFILFWLCVSEIEFGVCFNILKYIEAHSKPRNE